MTTPKNPQGQYQAPQGYRPQPQATPWRGAYKNGQPTITGVTPLKAAAIKNDAALKGGLPDPNKKSSQDIANEESDVAAADKAKRSMAYEKGYQDYRNKLFAPPAAAPVLSDDQKQKKNLVAGGIQPYEADQAIAQQHAAAAAKAPPTVPAAAPVAPVGTAGTTPAVGAPKPVAPPAPAQPSTIGENGSGGSMRDWIDQSKARQSTPNSITPQGSDATGFSGSQQHVADIQKANAPTAPAKQAMRPAVDPQAASVAANEAAHQQQVQDQIYPENSAKHQAQQASNAGIVAKANADDISALGKSMRPDTIQPAADTSDTPPERRAKGGPVKGITRREDGGPVQMMRATKFGVERMADDQAGPPRTVNESPGQEPVGNPPLRPSMTHSTITVRAEKMPDGQAGPPRSTRTVTPDGRAMGGPVVGGVPVGGVTDTTGVMAGADRLRADGRKKGGPVKGGVIKREEGGAVVHYTPNPKPFEQKSTFGAMRPGIGAYAPAPVTRLKKGGPAKGSKGSEPKPYLVGEAGTPQKPKPELFMPNDEKSGQPIVLGKDGPEVGTFPTDGTVIPNKALAAMKKKFSSSQGGDDDADAAPMPGSKDKKSPMNQVRTSMRPQAAVAA